MQRDEDGRALRETYSILKERKEANERALNT